MRAASPVARHHLNSPVARRGHTSSWSVWLSSCENFVSRLDICSGEEKPNWLGTMDASLPKLELAASSVAICSIHPLKISMNAEQTDNDKLL